MERRCDGRERMSLIRRKCLLFDWHLQADTPGRKKALQKNKFLQLILFSGSASAEVWETAMNSGFCRGVNKNSKLYDPYKKVAQIVGELIPKLHEEMEEWDILCQLETKYNVEGVA